MRETSRRGAGLGARSGTQTAGFRPGECSQEPHRDQAADKGSPTPKRSSGTPFAPGTGLS